MGSVEWLWALLILAANMYYGFPEEGVPVFLIHITLFVTYWRVLQILGLPAQWIATRLLGGEVISITFGSKGHSNSTLVGNMVVRHRPVFFNFGFEVLFPDKVHLTMKFLLTSYAPLILHLAIGVACYMGSDGDHYHIAAHHRDTYLVHFGTIALASFIYNGFPSFKHVEVAERVGQLWSYVGRNQAEWWKDYDPIKSKLSFQIQQAWLREDYLLAENLSVHPAIAEDKLMFHYAHGYRALHEARWDNALEHYKVLFDTTEENDEIWSGVAASIALIHLYKDHEQGKTKALDLAEQASAINPSGLTTLGILAEAQLANGLNAEAEKSSYKILKYPRSHRPELTTAVYAVARKRQHKSYQRYESQMRRRAHEVTPVLQPVLEKYLRELADEG